MPADTVSAVLAQRFHIGNPPTVIAQTPARDPITFTHLQSPRALRERSLSMQGEEGFAFQVPLSGEFFSEAWIDGRHQRIPPAVPGSVYLFDLSSSPTVNLDTPFNTLRLYLSRQTLNDLAYQRGLPAVGGLSSAAFGAADPVLHGMAHTLAAAMAEPRGANGLFFDYMALAFHDHISRRYSHLSSITEPLRGGLAPWQLRRAQDFIDAHLAGDPSIAQLASESGLSTSHFARAFKQTMGMAPHQWLTQKRIAAAKALLRSRQKSLAEVALACGFVDQSHFTRVFSRHEGQSPGKWQRLNLE